MQAKKPSRYSPLIAVAVMLITMACFALQSTPSVSGPETLYTQAAQTIIAQSTVAPGLTAIARLTQMAQIGAPATASSTAATLPTQVPPSVTFIPPSPTFIAPSSTPLPPTATAWPWRPSPTEVEVYTPCDWAQFVMDITVPDGSALPAGAAFTKIWRLRNIGSCTWTSAYRLIYDSGNRMQAIRSRPLPRLVRPGETVDLAIDLVAPDIEGHYRGYWMLSNDNGEPFGIGAYADKPFWVDINVIASGEGYAYDFIANMCAATWRSGTQYLPCPGDQYSPDGSVILLAEPRLENSRRENEPALWMRPNAVRGGWITGVYPKYKVQSGDHFLADIGCLKDNPSCDVTFYLKYQVSGKPVTNLGAWREVYDGGVFRINLDLSSLAGQSVQFTLEVYNNGKASNANAFWLAPSIRKYTPIPTPSGDSSAAERAARQTIAAATGISLSQMVVTSVTPVQWADSCLGVHQPGQVCMPAIVPGWRILLSGAGHQFEAHTNQDGTTVFWFET
jgi:hypothetical protein